MSAEATITETITYEQPLNESMRICLRLEYLFNQLKQYMDRTDPDSSKLAVSALVNTLDVINRPDLKSKLTQTLTQYVTILGQLEQFPQVDPNRLQTILKQLNTLILSLHHQKCRVGERLRNNEFLNQIRSRQSNPGGSSTHLTPAYALWLKTSTLRRQKDIEIWASEFSELQQIVDLILFLIRSSGKAKTIIACNGFYQQNLDPSLPYEIIRITVPTHYNVFPEFSVGRHRLAIRFLQPNYQDNGRPIQMQDDVEFELNHCRV